MTDRSTFTSNGFLRVYVAALPEFGGVGLNSNPNGLPNLLDPAPPNAYPGIWPVSVLNGQAPTEDTDSNQPLDLVNTPYGDYFRRAHFTAAQSHYIHPSIFAMGENRPA